MREPVAYGAGFAVVLPLVSQADTKIFKTSPTIAAGDWKVQTDRLASATPTFKTRAFTSGGTKVPRPGETVVGATSAATARVVGFRLTSGTWAGGDAAGILVLEADSGTFQSENLDIGGTSNVMTIGGALSAAGVFAEVALGMVIGGVTSTTGQCQQIDVILHDASGAEWCDSGAQFKTTGHEDADDPMGCVLTDTIASGTGQSTTNIRLSGAPAAPAVMPAVDYYFEVVAGTHIGYCGYVKTINTVTTNDTVPYVALANALSAGDVVKYYRAARMPGHTVTGEAAALAASTELLATKAKTDNLPSDPADESLIIAATDAILARCLTAAAALRISDREALGGTITVSAGSHTTTSCVASNGASGTRVKGRAGLVVSGAIPGRAIRFTSDIGASGAFTYTDLYGNAVPVALANADVIQY